MHQFEIEMMARADAEYAEWARVHADELDAAAKAEWVASLCEGHESLRGDSMGAEVYCDGTCVPASYRTDEEYCEYLDSLIPDYA